MSFEVLIDDEQEEEPEVFLTHQGLTVYRCYDEDGVVAGFWYTLDPEDCDMDNPINDDVAQFDVRDLRAPEGVYASVWKQITPALGLDQPDVEAHKRIIEWNIEQGTWAEWKEHAAAPAHPPLWKTTIVIWSEFNPTDRMELSALAREAESGDAYCSRMHSERVQNPALDPSWDGTEFFSSADNETPLVLLTTLLEALPAEYVLVAQHPEAPHLSFWVARNVDGGRSEQWAYLEGLGWPLGVAGASLDEIAETLGVTESWCRGFEDRLAQADSLNDLERVSYLVLIKEIDQDEYQAGQIAAKQWQEQDEPRLLARLKDRQGVKI